MPYLHKLIAPLSLPIVSGSCTYVYFCFCNSIHPSLWTLCKVNCFLTAISTCVSFQTVCECIRCVARPGVSCVRQRYCHDIMYVPPLQLHRCTHWQMRARSTFFSSIPFPHQLKFYTPDASTTLLYSFIVTAICFDHGS